MKCLRYIALLLAGLFGLPHVFAQSSELVEANRFYQAGDLPAAKAVLDELVKRPDGENSAQAWVLRGFVYKDMYKGLANAPEGGELRREALTSLHRSVLVDTAKEYAQSSSQAYEFLCKTIYNDAAKALNELDDARAVSLYSNYKENVLRSDPTHVFKDRDIEFSNALGTVMTKRFNQNREDTSWFAKAIANYSYVLGLDSDNYGANYNLATLYYNRGVYNIQRITVGTTIPDLQDIQRVAKEFFLKALPYMLKAHNMNPKRRETLLGLEGIHYSLQNVEKSEEYHHKYQALDQADPPPPPQPQAPKDK
jgi:tetratricopeptide (TPR) repeat protein